MTPSAPDRDPFAGFEQLLEARPPEPAPTRSVTARMRSVHQATAELRQGRPVVLCAARPLVLLAAEPATDAGLAAFDALAGVPGILLVATVRAAAILRRPIGGGAAVVALRLADGVWNSRRLRPLADPLADEPRAEPGLEVAEPLPDSDAAFELAKLARLLPAVLVAPLAAAAGADLRGATDVFVVDAADVRACRATLGAGLQRVAEASVPLEDAADARVIAFRAPESALEHLAIVIGRPEGRPAPLVRVHSACFTGDLLGSLRCDCGPQLRSAIRLMAQEGAGIVLYLAQEGRGIGLVNKLRAYALQDRGLDTLDANRALGWGADERDFMVAATMLEQLGVRRVRLLTNNPDKLAALAACGVEIAGRESHVILPNGVNDRYLATKAKRFGHLLG